MLYEYDVGVNLIEAESLLRALAEGLAFIPYFPLASGLLGGRYRKGQPPPADSRFHRHVDGSQARPVIDLVASLAAAR